MKLDHAPIDPTDQASLQRGAHAFVNYCLTCHSASYMRYNRLQDLGLTEQQIRDNLIFTGVKNGSANSMQIAEVQFFGDVAGTPPVLDYALLGVGADGHVASVFPGAIPPPGGPSVTWTDRSPKPPARRMTLSLETLARSRRVAVAAFDAPKADVIAAAVRGADPDLPLSRVLRLTGRPLLLLTPDAASAL